MHPCGSCGCSSQQGATIVAFISTGHYLIQLIMICVFAQENSGTGADGQPLVRAATSEEYYALISTQILLILMSVLLFVGVRYMSICLILPWIIMTALADIGYFVFVVSSFYFTIATYHVLYLTALISSIFLFSVVSYLLWVVIYFMMELLAQRNSYQQFGDPRAPGGGMDSDGETPVKKYMFKMDTH